MTWGILPTAPQNQWWSAAGQSPWRQIEQGQPQQVSGVPPAQAGGFGFGGPAAYLPQSYGTQIPGFNPLAPGGGFYPMTAPSAPLRPQAQQMVSGPVRPQWQVREVRAPDYGDDPQGVYGSVPELYRPRPRNPVFMGGPQFNALDYSRGFGFGL